MDARLQADFRQTEMYHADWSVVTVVEFRAGSSRSVTPATFVQKDGERKMKNDPNHLYKKKVSREPLAVLIKARGEAEELANVR